MRGGDDTAAKQQIGRVSCDQRSERHSERSDINRGGDLTAGIVSRCCGRLAGVGEHTAHGMQVDIPASIRHLVGERHVVAHIAFGEHMQAFDAT